MQIGVTLRNMGDQATAAVMRAGAQAAEARGFESLWITDHIAIPPDDAEGSGGLYLDTLTTLAWLAAATDSIRLGSGVLILPYRAALPTAKQIATVQTLSGGRLVMGVGIGWMDAEFKALGVDRHRRGQISDATLRFINTCFEHDEVMANGQSFLFKPRPPKPPLLIGGRAPHALARAVSYGDGWLPMARRPDQLRDDINTYRHMAEEAGKTATVTVMAALPEDAAGARALRDGYGELGVDRLVCAVRYETLPQYAVRLDELAAWLDLQPR